MLCTEHTAPGGGGGTEQSTIYTCRRPTFCEWKELELKGDWGERNVCLLAHMGCVFGCSGKL